MATMTSKLPTSDFPLFKDPDLVRFLEGRLAPLHGASLKRAQEDLVKFARSNFAGSWDKLIARLDALIKAAARDKDGDR